MARKLKTFWKGPDIDGITYSLLCKFLVCRERFRLLVVDGIREAEAYNPSIEFGSMWHEAEEARAGKKNWKRAAGRYRDRLRGKYPASEAAIAKTYNLVCAAYRPYVEHWSQHRDERMRKPVAQEETFAVPYKLPSGRMVILRGKFDEVCQVSKSLYLQENKTKGQIDEQGIQDTIQGNLQTMIYQLARRISRPKERMKGVIYNVIRRPLSDRYAIKQRKTETEKQFYDRLSKDIQSDSSHYFKRWKTILTAADIDQFCERSLHPILEQLWDWWIDITDTLRQGKSPFIRDTHFQMPWGVYNPLGSGFRGDYFTYLTTGSKSNLEQVTSLFPELGDSTDG